MSTTVLEGGKYQMSVDNVLIPGDLLGDIAVQYTEAVKERTTQLGTIRTPAGTVEEASMTFTLFLPNIDYLKNIFPENYNEPTNTGANARTGNLVFGGNSCQTYNTHIFNIHPTCEANDNNDWHFEGTVNRDFNPTLNGTDDVSIELTVNMSNSEALGGMLRLGTGDLSQNSKWDPTTQATIAA